VPFAIAERVRLLTFGVEPLAGNAIGRNLPSVALDSVGGRQ
jgi:hypothetical protein